ncbi:hypothetical protein [Parasphingorhabdus sp.]|uniref:hypothetical protein n=1 Tax=Parasphingorhabdus sp. TaxID=2709688 RepID=UPI0030028EE3
MLSELTVEQLDESSGVCDCCGNASRKVWGLVHSGERTVAAYWLHWTIGHLDTEGANFDLIVGSWGDGTGPQDRFAASLLYREPVDSPPAFMVIDASERQIAGSELFQSALRREDIIGTPIAEQLFAFVDAIWLQDSRIF